jgi:hypothetical protein
MNRFALFACASFSALALDGCLLNWNQFRPRDADVDASAQLDVEAHDTGVVTDTGVAMDTDVAEDTGVFVDSGVPVDSGIAMDASPDALPDALADSRPDATVVDADPGCTGPVVVNEVVHTGMTGTDEFIELRNNGPCTVDLTGWRVQYMSASGTISGSAPSVTFMAGDVIGPGREVFVASTASPLAPMALRTFTAGIAQAGGGIALFNRSNERVDSVAYGTLSAMVDGGHPYAEPISNMAAPTYTTAPQSIARSPNGHDTDNNAMDFRIAPMASPGAANP